MSPVSHHIFGTRVVTATSRFFSGVIVAQLLQPLPGVGEIAGIAPLGDVGVFSECDLARDDAETFADPAVEHPADVVGMITQIVSRVHSYAAHQPPSARFDGVNKVLPRRGVISLDNRHLANQHFDLGVGILSHALRSAREGQFFLTDCVSDREARRWGDQ